MPIFVKNAQFTDNFGYSGVSYKGNAGDELEMELTISESIRVTTVNNPWQFDPILNVITSPTQNFLDEGFRPNDFVTIVKYDSNGVVIQTHTTTVSTVSATEINLDTWASGLFYDLANNEVMIIVPTVTAGGIVRRRQDLEILFNHSLNDQVGNPSSLIDGEQTKILCNGVGALASGNSLTGSLVGNQSGQFLEIVDVTYNGLDADGFNEYTLTFTFTNSGIYDSAWFALGDCLKIYIEGLWSSYSGESFNRSVFTFDQQANTGWFGEANNASVPNGSAVLTSISDLKYNNAVTSAIFSIELGTATLSDLGIGGAYLSIDDNYYKNRQENQRNLTYLLPTTSSLTVGNTYTSLGGVGSYSSANWSVEIVNVAQAGNLAIIQVDWTPNGSFQNFMNNDRTDGDRLFYLWLRIGNTNHLIYNKQLSFEQPVGGALTLNNNYGFLDHSQNTEVATGDLFGFKADTEDDIAFYATFNLVVGDFHNYESINLRVEAFNTATNDSFTLQQSNFNFGSVTYQASTLKYLLNETATINPDLPTTSLKRDAKVYLTGNQSGKQYEVAVYYPFLLNWRYWLSLSGVSTDFAPDQNQNWEQYDNPTNWEIRAVVELIQNGLAYTASNTLVDYAYDNEPDINSDIKLRLQSDNTAVTIIPDGEQLFIESTHELLTGNWDEAKTWGMLTIEPKESAPRWICSSIVPFDNNSQNPITPISGLLCSLTYTSPNVAVLKCKFDPSKIDTSNGIKITAKIKQGCNNIVEQNKITTDDEQKLTTNDDDKIIA